MCVNADVLSRTWNQAESSCHFTSEHSASSRCIMVMSTENAVSLNCFSKHACFTEVIYVERPQNCPHLPRTQGKQINAMKSFDGHTQFYIQPCLFHKHQTRW
jgi:hypothetical protein